MTARSGHRFISFSLITGLGLGLLACSGSTGLELIPEAVVSCAAEEPTPEMQNAGSTMLPGRVCGACHRTGGQAMNSPWTLSGTIFNDQNASCNGGGQAGIGVDVLYSADDPNGAYVQNQVQPGGTLRTNDVGNFYTAARFVSPMKIRIYDPNDATRQMFMTTLVGQDPNTGATTRVDCNFCHYPGSPNLIGNNGHVYLPPSQSQ
jgi:hypothetical protein